MSENATPDDKEIGSLIDQLQNTVVASKRVAAEPDPLKKEEMEKFVIENAGELVRQSLDFMKSMKDFVASAPNGDDISAVANLVTATSSAIESLNKLIVTDKKVEASVKLKQMDIINKREIAEQATDKLLATREEVFKRLLTHRPVVSAEVIDVSVFS